MARIELSFYDKTYTIEYNRESIKDFLMLKKEGVEEIEQVINLIKCGLKMHHADDMPSRDVILAWVMAMGSDIKDFTTALRDLIQGAIEALEVDRKNLKWGKVEA